MKTKSIISFLILLLFAILGSGSFTEGELKIFGIMIVVAVIVGIGVHYMLKKLKMIEALKSVE